MNLKERMFFLIGKEGINPNQFYTISGLGNGYLDKVGDTLRKPTIEKIKNKFPHWNIDWILNEEGEPINKGSEPIEELAHRIDGNWNVIANRNFKDINIGTSIPIGTPKKKASERLTREVERLLAENNKLSSENELLRKNAKDRDEFIELLKDKIKDLETKVQLFSQ